MLISSYNMKALGDILIVICAPNVKYQDSETRSMVTRIYDTSTGKTLGYNFKQVTKILGDLSSISGQIILTEKQVSKLNNVLLNVEFNPDLIPDTQSKFVVGCVKKISPHPYYNHLNVMITIVENGHELQIVSSSQNIQTGVRVVVAKIGAMMPNGLIIWPRKIHGVESNGMIASGRELHIPNAPNQPGALILPGNYEIGQPFCFELEKTFFC